MSDQCQMHAEHCWHDTGCVLLSNPPIHLEICCWCGDGRSRRGPSAYVPYHEKYMPWQYATEQAPAPTSEQS